MASREDETRWRDALKRLGTVRVRQQLQQPAGDDAANAETSGIVTGPPDPPHQFVDAWYRTLQQRRQRATDVRQYLVAVLVVTAVAVGILFLMSG